MIKKYYLLLLPVVIAFILFTIINKQENLIIFFTLAGIAGVIGETVFSIWWKLFFKKPFWTYSVQTLYKSYTSTLNFIPWAIGGVIYIAIAEYINYVPSTQNLTIFWFSYLILVLITFLSKINENYFLFILPVVIPAIVTGALIPLICFGIIACLAEYAFGKVCYCFLSKKLWTYNYRALDNGHFTPLSIIPFSLAGFYFITIYTAIVQISLL